MRILLISPYVPVPAQDGGSIRVVEIARGLAQHHEVGLACLGGPVSTISRRQLADLGVELLAEAPLPDRRRAAFRSLRTGSSYYWSRFDSPTFAAELSEVARHGHFDTVQVEYTYMAHYAPDLGRPWVLDAHNVESSLADQFAAGEGSRLYNRYAERESRLRRTEEAWAAQACGVLLAVSDDDAARFRTLAPGVVVEVAPNGVDTARFGPRAPDGSPRALFVGKLDYRPNAAALRWFIDEVLPLVRRRRPEFVLQVVGQVSETQRRDWSVPGVELLGRVDETEPLLAAAALSVVPLLHGSGTRLKVLESLGARCPVVTTSIGAEGLEVLDGVHARVADTAQEFAAAVGDVLDDPDGAARRAEAGYAHVEARFAWSATVDVVDAAHRQVAAA